MSPAPLGAARALRGLLLAGLAVAALLLARGGGGGRTLTTGPGSEERLVAALVAAPPPERIVWPDAAGPDGRAAWLMSPGPAIPVLALAVGAARLHVEPPARPVAQRAAALAVTVGGAAGDTVTVSWGDAVGAVDSLRVPLGPGGSARTGLRVRPARAGWHEWTVRAAGDSARVGAWVGPGRPVRVLALAGAPGPESRFALRALDEAGARVDARFDLGRVAIGPARPDPEPYDVVLVMDGAAVGEGAAGAIADFARRGGGVLIAPGAGPAPAASRTLRPLLAALAIADSLAPGPRLEAGAAPAWSLPPELSPLPSAPVPASTLALAGPVPARVLASADGAPLIAARAFGRGRVAFLGLAESWRWRMEGGEVDAHRAWWRDWAEWAASGLRGPILAAAPAGPVPTGAVVRVRFEALDTTAILPARVRLERPDGTTEALATAVLGAGGARELRFLASSGGAYRVVWEGGETGVAASGRPAARGPAERSLLALGSGAPRAQGVPLPPGAGPEEREGRVPGRGAGDPALPAALGAALAALLLAEWTVRRLHGGP